MDAAGTRMAANASRVFRIRFIATSVFELAPMCCDYINYNLDLPVSASLFVKRRTI
jgi:hypothetical protein